MEYDRYQLARDAINRIKLAIDHTDACDKGSHRPDDLHDSASWVFRNHFLIHIPDSATDADIDEAISAFPELQMPAVDRATLVQLRDDLALVWEAANSDAPWLREEITFWALSDSLCPIHFCDYAMCFEDDDPECATIRLIHPGHDT